MGNNATETLDRVRSTADAQKSDRTRSPQMDVGDHVRQGDLYIYRIAGVPKGAERVESPDRQLAPGTTQGSRHCLDSLDGVTVHRLAEPNPLQGPILDLAEPRTVEHPEHGHVELQPGCYAVTYQRAHADELRRTQD